MHYITKEGANNRIIALINSEALALLDRLSKELHKNDAMTVNVERIDAAIEAERSKYE
jgi:hypothetical protein